MAESGGSPREPKGKWPPTWLTAPRLVLAVLLLSASVALFAGARPVRHYFVESSDSCNSCHVAAASDVHDTSHAELACSSCHENRLDQNLKQWALSLVSEQATEHARTDLGACKACHAAGDVEPWRLKRSQGHVAHVLVAEKPLACSACHELSRHRTTAKPDECARCHTKVSLFDHTAQEMPTGEPAPCLSCHEFLAPTDVGKQTLVTDCRRCHGTADPSAPVSRFALTTAAAKVSPGQIHANLATCSSCHNPHAADAAVRNLGTDCTRCHDRVSEEHHEQKQPDKFTCSTCHEVHGPRAALTASCASCHAPRVQEPPTTVAREHQRCTQCHAAHSFVAPKDGCQGCHAKAVGVLAAWGAKKHAACETCHQAHDPAPETARCAECHAKLANHSHPSCTSCHAPHEDAEHVAACGSCHAQELAGAQSSLPAHRTNGCATCHQPHAKGFEVTACRNCHAQEVRLVATAQVPQVPRPGHRECSSCHEPHVFGASEGACSKCHAIPVEGAHAGACEKCHEEHGPPNARAKACGNCHENVPRPAGKHSECTSCHAQAHAVDDGRVKSCESCHGGQAKAASTWQAPKHRACDSCHEEHQPTKPAPCAGCHGGLVATVKAAGHRCSSCHETHAPPAGIAGRCGSCHQGPAAAASQRGPTHSACASCHEPHSTTAVPSCQSCHEKPPALHSVPEHGRCNDCHSAHGKPRNDPRQCLTCHKQQTNHFPGTNSCVGCHLFE